MGIFKYWFKADIRLGTKIGNTDEHSSLFRQIKILMIIKKFYNFGTWVQCYKTFYDHNLLMITIS
jgi:hypothetical protein